MRWGDFRRSDNVDDRRGGGFGMPSGGGRGGLGLGAIVILGLVGWALGIDPRLLIGGAEMLTGGSSGYVTEQKSTTGTPKDQDGQFVAAVLGNTEDVWAKVLPEQTGKAYRDPGLVMFTGGTRSGCGIAQSAMGPFYCPLDQKVYLDVAFFEEMRTRFRAEGDFAYAYVIAHEVGHHVENLLGILPRVQQAQQQASSQAEANRLSVRVELMADCLAGVWAYHSNTGWNSLEPGDIEAALNAASAIGDDRLQQASQGRVVPDSFTHGTSAQRVRWFTRGFQTGKVASCDAFAQQQL
ncbi:neutral zinc metallopeptidase [Pseudochelatococcus sp. G4_1912]|uniref:KPN_02809 family neutral zinc metallopeptidase n=1 Tax=Pseudochelatococcus sp. G4_1912 TaxID=3114288 RepID=UPI0039C66661